MNSIRRYQPWLATGVAVLAVFLVVSLQRGSAQVSRADAMRAASSIVPAVAGIQSPPGYSPMVQDSGYLFILRGNKLYKVQMSTMSVFATLNLN